MSFSWVPFYREVAQRVLEYENRQDELLSLLREMKDAGLPTIPLEHDQPVLTPITAIDPFTFMANFGRTLEPSRFRICEWIHDKWNIQAPVPTDFEGCIAVQSNYKGSWFFGELKSQSQGDNELLWRLAKQAYDGDVQTIDAELLARCLNRPNLQMRKLTFGLSWINPEKFLPIRNSILREIKSRGIEFNRGALLGGDLAQYEELMKKVSQINPDIVDFVAQTQKPVETVYKWVPFYREVAERVLEYQNRQVELVKVLREIEADGAQTMYLTENQAGGEMTELEVMEPFTFLANFSRTGDEKAAQSCRILAEKWNLQAPVPTFFHGRVRVMPRHPWFFSSVGDGRAPGDIASLWDLAIHVLHDEEEELDAALFARCLQVRGVGAAKLTTGLFWLAPKRFLSVAAPIIAFLEKQGVNCNRKLLEKGDFAEYQNWLEAARVFNNDFLDISYQAWAAHNNQVTLEIEDDEEETVPNAMPDFPLNQILYGPPGTGKTYSTIERAVEIIDGVADSNPEVNKKRFDALRKSGQIEFVTFHQSFSYEEFIEGLRPILSKGGDGTARYEVRAGVLKKLALRATDVGAAVEELKRTAKKTPNSGAPKKASSALSFEAAWGELKRRIENEELFPDEGLSTESFKKLVLSDDAIEGENLLADKSIRLFRTTKKVQQRAWEILPTDRDASATGFVNIGVVDEGHYSFCAVIHNLLRKIAANQPGVAADNSSEIQVPRYVLIVDEINRGNISKILGELITLLEPDKRIGAENELLVQLPVSLKPFGLPPNLYLIGTMNTADKSLALLDVALRRRFDFIEMVPNPKHFPDFALDVLIELNLRLEIAIDREHRIGHAVFMKCAENQFNAVFRAKVVPLLQEFFYNDWETLRSVLGEGGDKSGAFVKKLEAPPGMKARTKWRWWFDADGAGDFDILAQLKTNYSAKSE